MVDDSMSFRWQKVKVIHPYKVGRVADLTPKSHRPINVSSFPLNTMERLMDRYIRDEILERKPLTISYQPGKSTD